MRIIRQPSDGSNGAHTRGAALVMMLLVLIVVAIFGITINLRSVNEAYQARRQSNQSLAFWAADAGVQRTYWEIKSNNCAGIKNLLTGTACSSCTSCGTGNRVLNGSITGAEFEIVLDAAMALGTSSGYWPTKAASKSRRQISFSFSSNPLFGYAAFSKGQMTIDNNALVDSYTSSKLKANGTPCLYGEVCADGTVNKALNGDVGSNGTAAGIINIGNNAIIKGDVSTGAGAGNEVTNNGTITGTISNNANVTLSNVIVPPALTALPDGGVLTVPKNGSRTLAAGDYRYQGLSFSEKGELIINGVVNMYLTAGTGIVSEVVSAENNNKITINDGAKFILYVDGSIDINNNVQINNNAAGKTAADFQIYSAGSGTTISIKNNATAYVTVYAPNSDIDISNNANYYGAIVGKTVNLSNNTSVHYDEALGSLANPFVSASVRNWQEI